MRALLIGIVAALFGAAAFHIYYLRLDTADRCGWDHVFDDQAKQRCRTAAETGAAEYGPRDRKRLDELIERVGQ